MSANDLWLSVLSSNVSSDGASCVCLHAQTVLSKMGNRKELSTDLKQTILNLPHKGHYLRKVGQLVNKSEATVQYIVNIYKY